LKLFECWCEDLQAASYPTQAVGLLACVPETASLDLHNTILTGILILLQENGVLTAESEKRPVDLEDWVRSQSLQEWRLLGCYAVWLL
jgi:hypothetical protein